MLKEEIDYNAPLKTEEEVYELILSDPPENKKPTCPALYTKEPYGRNGMNIAVRGSRKSNDGLCLYVYGRMAV